MLAIAVIYKRDKLIHNNFRRILITIIPAIDLF